MKTVLVILSILAGMLAAPKKSECAWCPTYKCFGANSCGSACSCVTLGGEYGGRCVSVEGSPE